MKVKVAQSGLTLYEPMDYPVRGILQARILEWVAVPFSRGLPNPGIEPRCPTLQADSLPAEPKGKPKNTGVGSLSLLQGMFPTQESNWGLLHCRQTWAIREALKDERDHFFQSLKMRENRIGRSGVALSQGAITIKTMRGFSTNCHWRLLWLAE